MSKDVKLKLDKIGPGFCLEKWTSAVFHLQRGVTNSCHHCPGHAIPLEEVKKNIHAIHNTPYKKEQRKTMMEGGWPDECNFCSAVEKQGGISDRIIVSGRERSLKHYDYIVNDWSQDFKPTSVDVSFNNVCNLACSYCGPQSSSTWVKDIEEGGVYPNNYNSIPGDIQRISSENPYTEYFWQWFNEIYPGLYNLVINGGEPLMIKDTYRCLEYIIANPNKNLNVNINSNLCVEDKLIDKLIDLLKQIEQGNLAASVSIYTSNEAKGLQAEYLRHGLNYDQWTNNIRKILSSTQNVKVGVMSTYTVLSPYSYTGMLQDLKSFADEFGVRRIIVMPKYIRHPAFFDIRLLPLSNRYRIVESLDYIKTNISNEQTRLRFEQILTYYDSGQQEDHTALKEFIVEYDKRRNLNFKAAFPEIDWLE